MVKSGSFQVGPGSLAGRLGSGLGSGLGESIPKEVEQYRLSQGLKNFQENAGNQTPGQQFASLASIPGINRMPQVLQQFPEILKLERERQNAINMGDDQAGNNPSQNIQNPKDSQNISPLSKNQTSPTRENVFDIQQKLSPKRAGITTQEPYQTALNEIREPTQQEILSKRTEILKANPYMSPEAAGNLAQEYFTRQNEQKKSKLELGKRQQAIQEETDNKFEKEFKLLTKRAPEQVEGTAFSDMRDAAREEVALGTLTPDQAAKKYARLGYQIEKNITKLEKMGQSPLITQDAKVIKFNLNEGANLWAEANRSREYSDHIQSEMGTSPELSDSIAFPIKKSKNVNEIIENYKPKNPFKTSQTNPFGMPTKTKSTDSAIELANKIGKVELDRNFNINSAIVALKNKDPFFDDEAFRRQLTDLYNNGKLKLNSDQRDELISPSTTWLPNLKDWWLKISGNL